MVSDIRWRNQKAGDPRAATAAAAKNSPLTPLIRRPTNGSAESREARPRMTSEPVTQRYKYTAFRTSRAQAKGKPEDRQSLLWRQLTSSSPIWACHPATEKVSFALVNLLVVSFFFTVRNEGGRQLTKVCAIASRRLGLFRIIRLQYKDIFTHFGSRSRSLSLHLRLVLRQRVRKVLINPCRRWTCPCTRSTTVYIRFPVRPKGVSIFAR